MPARGGGRWAAGPRRAPPVPSWPSPPRPRRGRTNAPRRRCRHRCRPRPRRSARPARVARAGRRAGVVDVARQRVRAVERADERAQRVARRRIGGRGRRDRLVAVRARPLAQRRADRDAGDRRRQRHPLAFDAVELAPLLQRVGEARPAHDQVARRVVGVRRRVADVDEARERRPQVAEREVVELVETPRKLAASRTTAPIWMASFVKYFLPSGPAAAAAMVQPDDLPVLVEDRRSRRPGPVSVEYWTRSLKTADTLLSVNPIFFGPPCGCWMMLTKSLTVGSARLARLTKP